MFNSKWTPRGFTDHQVKSDLVPMDEIIKANEFQASQVIDSSTSLREGDIAVSTGRRSKVCFAKSCQWDKSVDGHVYIAYRLAPQYTETETKVIKKGMENIEEGTCVRFVPRTHQRDYLDIQSKSGCWSYLGVRGGRQTVSLQTPHCMRAGVTSHELMHAMGFVHEQSRVDRDNYVTIMWNNIWRDRLRNFEKFKTDNMNLPYDFGSIMHFGQYAYSEDGQPTIVPKGNANARLGLASAPSHIDKMKINSLYKCGLRPPRGMSFKEGDIANSYMRSAITCPGNACLWPKSVDGFVYVPYIVSPLYDDMDRITIETGMQDISIDTCVKFVPRTHEGSFLDIQPRYGCWSFLGQTGGSQVLSLQSPGCMWSGVASHELMHALGFVHEQSRSDRDRHVTIVWRNIQPGHNSTPLPP
ncbi:hypothetical protein NHX12_006870 [Muraenolepis orangiensis]|uniref:Metalloendopeptidase n=1 Tax=Muraenolepis orangiensis TaxID=630683 RepID=A0A9Q0DQI3_9TELE|nr:hypothetical protein NHX12_006870 [Muraenolepis orangiensis]